MGLGKGNGTLKKWAIFGTLPETNIAPKNGWLEYYFPIGEAYFQGRQTLVSGRVSTFWAIKLPTLRATEFLSVPFLEG